MELTSSEDRNADAGRRRHRRAELHERGGARPHAGSNAATRQGVTRVRMVPIVAGDQSIQRSSANRINKASTAASASHLEAPAFVRGSSSGENLGGGGMDCVRGGPTLGGGMSSGIPGSPLAPAPLPLVLVGTRGGPETEPLPPAATEGRAE